VDPSRILVPLTHISGVRSLRVVTSYCIPNYPIKRNVNTHKGRRNKLAGNSENIKISSEKTDYNSEVI